MMSQIHAPIRTKHNIYLVTTGGVFGSLSSWICTLIYISPNVDTKPEIWGPFKYILKK